MAIAVSLTGEKFDQTASARMPSWSPYISASCGKEPTRNCRRRVNRSLPGEPLNGAIVEWTAIYRRRSWSNIDASVPRASPAARHITDITATLCVVWLRVCDRHVRDMLSFISCFHRESAVGQNENAPKTCWLEIRSSVATNSTGATLLFSVISDKIILISHCSGHNVSILLFVTYL